MELRQGRLAPKMGRYWFAYEQGRKPDIKLNPSNRFLLMIEDGALTFSEWRDTRRLSNNAPLLMEVARGEQGRYAERWGVCPSPDWYRQVQTLDLDRYVGRRIKILRRPPRQSSATTTGVLEMGGITLSDFQLHLNVKDGRRSLPRRSLVLDPNQAPRRRGTLLDVFCADFTMVTFGAP